MVALESTYSHEYLCINLNPYLKYCVIIKSDCKIEIDQKLVFFLLKKDDIFMRDIIMKNTNI